MFLCEVRIPTYKRPALLKRAIESLIAQTYSNWQALVLDDSPEQEAKSVVEAFNDDRILYRPHKTNLGRSKNIDYAFLSKAYVSGDYAFVLEDDNYLLPNFITENIRSIEENNVAIILRNQEIRLEKDGVSVPVGGTTRGRWFKQGLYSPIELRARLFFCEGISNGGLFWHTGKIKSNLQVGSGVEHSWHQELFRTLRIDEPVYFEPEPLCVFTEFEYIAKQINFAPKHNRGTQSIIIHLLSKYRDSIVQEAQKVASDKEAELLLERKLLNALYLNYSFKRLGKIETTKVLMKSFFRYIFFKDPFKKILAAEL